MDKLNPQQLKAVTTIKGPVLIVAGPGSGKTKVLTHRIVYLIKEKGIDPRNILAVTFTNKAAGEMKERVTKLLSAENNADQNAEATLKSASALNQRIDQRNISGMPTIGTFHSICARILRGQIEMLGYKQNFVIYDEDDQRRLIKRIMKNLGIKIDQFDPLRVLNTISRAKDELIDWKTYKKEAYGPFQKTVGKIYKNYQKSLLTCNAVDFDDLIAMTVELFRIHPKILSWYQERWQYILVDEYQDTSHSQYVLVNLLAKKYRNICAVGDDSQAIYSWRGADFRNILDFEKDYPKAKVILLEENYRSTQNILQASHHVIAKNIQRKEKKLWTKNSKGNPLIIYKAGDEKGEAKFIARRIKNLTYEGDLRLNDFVVLYRTNAQSRALEEAFLKYGIPYKVIGGVKFYQRREIKDILAYLKLIQNPNDSVSLRRIENIPPRKRNKKNKDFNNLISGFRKLSSKYPVSRLIRFILQDLEYEDYLKRTDPRGEERWENVLELLTVARKYNRFPLPLGLERFLEEVSLLTDADNVETSKEVVNLMTLHSAKGLEFKVVFIAGCEEGLLPHSLSQTKEKLEEERRLIYVGITRAKERVYLTFTDQRNLYGSTIKNRASEFLKDIPEKVARCCRCSWEEIKNEI